MKNVVIAIIAGYAVWTAVWLGGNALFFSDAKEVVGAGERYDATGPLVAIVGLSVVCSLLAGLVAAKIAGDKAPRAVRITALLLLLTGIGRPGECLVR